MPDVLACRHIDPAACPDVSDTGLGSDTSGHAFALVRDTAAQEWDTTASRHLRRADDFRAAAQFMVGSGFHPKAGRTTLRLAEVFAARMRRSKDGHFPFNIEATARELGLQRRAVLNHAQYLRELGLLAYIEHGSKTNSVRTRLGEGYRPDTDGYRGTATIFAAVAPPVWDEALGRRIDGLGYTARIAGVTEAGRDRAVEEARRKAAAKTPARRTSCTPSLVVPQDHRQLKIVGGKKDTSRKRARCPKNSPRPASTNRPRISPAECARGIALAEQLRQEVWWLNRGCARRLAYVLRPLIATGWTWQSLAAELLTWGVPGYLRDPAAYVRHELERRQHLGDLPHPATPTVRDDQVDDTGARHAEMLRRREENNDPTWQHYASQLRSSLRSRLAEAKQARQDRRPPRPEYQPMMRESEQAFVQAVPAQSRGANVSPRDIYRARALRQPEPVGRPTPEADQGWLEHLRDQHEAEQACASLRIELDDWERNQPTTQTAC
ncbi:hypothetical protein HRW14_07235 [Streptomyces lunaelactis]|uniref:hypothetical protein n=1 Tax=Streptomyces lunaelactis TaxID=1535768 RepID=UPI001585C8FE|nr:hypothetical protein [Streptomyces lunaelactis]NUK50092.1 hypothetical protein [Streptomyces lunaelactis]